MTNTAHQIPTALPGGRLEEKIGEYKPAFNQAGALAEANRCLYCHDAPCINACPTAINIPEFIRKIATDNLYGAANTILGANILGHSCARVCPVDVLCQGSCVFHKQQQPPIQIGRLQRYATDHALKNGMKFFRKGPTTGKRIAIVGAGPAGLACAHQLTVFGHEAVIFEASAYPGGLNLSGIAAYKMQSCTALEEVHQLMEIGFAVHCNTHVGRDVSIHQLDQDFDAILFATGLGADTIPNLDGIALEGVYGAVDLIRRLKLDPDFSLEQINHAVVIGGGNTAIDSVRELLHAGVAEVTMVYRRTAEEMSGYSHEWQAALAEGARVRWQTVVTAIHGDGHRVNRLHCQLVQKGLSPHSLETIADSTFTLAADLVAFAVGQQHFENYFTQLGIRFEAGKVQVDPETGQTSKPRYFAAGDCINGAKEVVNAVAEGKIAAQGIDRMLRDNPTPKQHTSADTIRKS